jgi:hypothetical protein
MGADIVNVIVITRIVVVVIIFSLPSLPEERGTEAYKEGRGCGGDPFGIDSAPSLVVWKGGQSKQEVWCKPGQVKNS